MSTIAGDSPNIRTFTGLLDHMRPGALRHAVLALYSDALLALH